MRCITEPPVILCNGSHHLTPLALIAACVHTCLHADVRLCRCLKGLQASGLPCHYCTFHLQSNLAYQRNVCLQTTDKPLAYSHFKAEGDVEFKSILFIPGKAPYDFMNNYYQNKPSLKLYVRRVFISDDFEELIPK